MDRLRSGITAEETYAARIPVHCLDQFFYVTSSPPCPSPVCPVLTEDTVKVAGLIKDGQIFVSILRARGIGVSRIPALTAPGTNPCCTAIGRKGIVIPGDKPPSHPTGGRTNPPFHVLIHPTEALLSLGYFTLVKTQVTFGISSPRHLRRKSIPSPYLSVQGEDRLLLFLKRPPDTVGTEADPFAYKGRTLPATTTPPHLVTSERRAAKGRGWRGLWKNCGKIVPSPSRPFANPRK